MSNHPNRNRSKYLMDDGSGFPPREVGQAEADRIIADQPIGTRRSAAKRLAAGEGLSDQYGFRIWLRYPPASWGQNI